jgi:hypothetical protein
MGLSRSSLTFEIHIKFMGENSVERLPGRLKRYSLPPLAMYVYDTAPRINFRQIVIMGSKKRG